MRIEGTIANRCDAGNRSAHRLPACPVEAALLRRRLQKPGEGIEVCYLDRLLEAYADVLSRAIHGKDGSKRCGSAGPSDTR